MRYIFVCVLTVYSFGSINSQTKPSPAQQTSFGELGIRHPVRLPKAAIKALNAFEKPYPDEPCGWIASVYDLNDDGIPDYIVGSRENCNGADNVHYWIVWNDSGKYKVVLFAACSGLDILKTKSGGFHNIRTSWDVAAEGATEFQQFKNGKYRIVRQWFRTHQ